MAEIQYSPIRAYTHHDLREYGELGRLFQGIVDDPKSAVQLQQAYLIYGPTGSGKSSACGALHAQLAAKKILVAWLDCAQIPGDPRLAEPLLEEMADYHIVILDDMGREPEHIRPKIGKLIFARHKRDARLDLITTNLTVNTESADNCDITRMYGEAVRSRLFGMCGRNVLCFNGQDRRL